MHAQVMSNNNGTGAQVNDLVAQVISVVEDNKKLKVKLAKSIKEKNEMEEENKKLKVTHKEQVLKKNKMMKRMKKQSDELSLTMKNFQARFVCPITQDVMEDPVLVAQTGNTYERRAVRRAVEEWFARSNTDPLTNEELEDATLIPNNVLRCAE